MSIINDLSKLGIGASLTHKYGDDIFTIAKEDDAVYRIDGEFETYTLVDLALKFGEKVVERKVYFMKKPYATHMATSHIAHTKADRAALIEQAKSSGMHLYFGTVGPNRTLVYPLILEWDSVKDVAPAPTIKQGKPTPPAKPQLIGNGCPFCGKSISSTPGRTLHVQHAHPERLEEYQELLAERNAPPKVEVEDSPYVHGRKAPIVDDEEDVVTLIEQSSTEEGHQCPYCRKKMSSTSGRTLHVKSAHPDKYLDYLKAPHV